MIRLGAYQPGSDQATDDAIRYHDELEAFLQQDRNEANDLEQGYEMLARILGGEEQ